MGDNIATYGPLIGVSDQSTVIGNEWKVFSYKVISEQLSVLGLMAVSSALVGK